MTFSYARPESLDEAFAVLRDAPDARVLCGGTDLIVGLRKGTINPSRVVDLKGIAELTPGVDVREGMLRIGATTILTEVIEDRRVNEHVPALAEGARVVGSIQIRNRATLAGNICNASPAADTAPALLVDDAVVVVAGSAGERRIPIDAFFVRSGVTTLAVGELVTAIELPRPVTRRGTVHLRRTRRRGHDLASVTLACAVDERGVSRIAYGSLGPRPILVVDETGLLADPSSPGDRVRARLDELFVDAAPSATSMRAGPDYRLAMLRVLGLRAVRVATERLAAP